VEAILQGTIMDDNRTYRDHLKADLSQAFNHISHTGSFAASGALPKLPLPGLHVDGVGDIGLPLSEEQIRLLIAKAQPQGGRLAEASVGKISEIGADALEFYDPAWQVYQPKLSQLAGTQLGVVDTPIRLKLEKMIIYEAGAMTKPHIDLTEKTPGMFGTLMICLPSAHTGGEPVWRYNREAEISGRLDANQWSFACWYSDVTYEVPPVQSGYLCVLIYDLAVRPDLTRPSASAFDLQKVPLRRTLEYWLRNLANNDATDVPNHLYHALDPGYKKPPLSPETLKPKDLIKMRALQGLAQELPFEIFLALLEKQEHGSIHRTGPDKPKWNSWDTDEDSEASYHSLCEVDETTLTAKTLRALDKTLISRDCKFDPRFCLMQDPFRDLGRPSESCYEDSATHTHRRTALLIVPRTKLGQFMAQCSFECPEVKECSEVNDTESEFSDYDDDIYESRGRRLALEDSKYFNECISALDYLSSIPSAQVSMLDALCMLFMSKRSKKLRRTDLLKVAFLYSHYTLFQIISVGHRGFVPIEFFDWAMEHINGLADADRAEKYQRWIPLLIQGYPSMADSLKIIAKMSNFPCDAAVKDEALSSSRVWMQNVTRGCITSFPGINKKPTVSDGESIVDAIFYLGETWENTAALLTSIIDRFPQAQATAFLLAVLLRLKTQAEAAGVPIGAIRELYGDLSFRVFNHNRKLCNVMTSQKIEWISSWGKVVPPPSQTQPYACTSNRDDTTSSELGMIVTPKALVQFSCNLHDLSTHPAELLEPIIQEISDQCPSFSGEDMSEIWMPFLYQLIRALQSRSVVLNKPVYQQLANRFVDQMTQRTLGDPPLLGVNFPVPPLVSCVCDDCTYLNQFLRNPKEKVGRFALPKNRRRHLQDKLTSSGIDCQHHNLEVGRPYALVVTKNHTFSDAMTAWTKQRSDLYASLFKHIHPPLLKVLLRPDSYSLVKHYRPT